VKNIVVDFESYYDGELSVDAIGLQNYVARSEAYLASLVSDEVEFCGSPEELGKDLNVDALNRDQDIQFWAANSNFDQAWWEKLYGKSHRPWKCILDVGASHQYPRNLAGLALAALRIKMDKGTRDAMKGVRYGELPDEGDDALTKRKVLEYCLNDSVREKELLDKMSPMSDIEDRIAEHTRMTNRRGVHIDTEKVDRDKSYLERLRFDAYKAIPWTRDCDTPLSYQRFAQHCKNAGVEPPQSLDKRDDICTEWAAANPKLAPVLKAMRDFRGANTKLEKLKTLLGNLTPEGVMPLELLYCGARHTRRWSSRGFNVQNLDKKPAFNEIMRHWPEFKDNPDKAGIFMREYIVPPPGKKFVILDFRQIEPRCLNWLAGNDELLEAIRAGFSYYEAYATASKGWRGAAGTLEADLGLEKYTLIKNEALGLGFGMGWRKFVDYAKVDPKKARATVDTFRKDNPKIVRMWRVFDSKIKKAALDRESHTLEIELPTGDLLRHFHIRTKPGEEGGYESFTILTDFTKASRQPNLWGGVLTENVTQRMARDVMAEAIVRVEDSGVPVPFHSHDEIITIVDASSAKSDLKEIEQMLSVVPAWCEGLPLAAKGTITDHYTKI
jgi:DNA polymerase